MEMALWTAQLLLAAIFFATGMTKLTQPRAQLAAGPMGWAADVTDGQRGKRDFVSAATIEADRYEVQVDEGAADDAMRVLSGMPTAA